MKLVCTKENGFREPQKNVNAAFGEEFEVDDAVGKALLVSDPGAVSAPASDEAKAAAAAAKKEAAARQKPAATHTK